MMYFFNKRSITQHEKMYHNCVLFNKQFLQSLSRMGTKQVITE